MPDFIQQMPYNGAKATADRLVAGHIFRPLPESLRDILFHVRVLS